MNTSPMSGFTVYQQRRRAGQCVECGKLAQGKSCRCPEHALAERKRAKKRRLALAAAGTCQRCRRLPAIRGGICDGCREKLPTLPSSQGPNVTHERRAENWQCRACGEDLPSDLFKSCESCRRDAAEATQAHRERMRAQGLCRCGKKLAKNSSKTTSTLGRKLPKLASRCRGCMTRRRKRERVTDKARS